MNTRKNLLKFDTLSGIASDIAQVFFAALVVGQFIEKESSSIIMTLGMLLSIGFWYVSLKFANK